MSDRRAEKAARANVPKYSIAGLFASGRLGLAEEAAIEELGAIRRGFYAMAVPASGWMSPRYTDSNDRPVPRQLSDRPAWQRYQRFFARWGRQALPPSPNAPWGLSWASVAVILITEPVTVPGMASRLGITPDELLEQFAAMVYDYARGTATSSPISSPLAYKIPKSGRRRARHGAKIKKIHGKNAQRGCST